MKDLFGNTTPEKKKQDKTNPLIELYGKYYPKIRCKHCEYFSKGKCFIRGKEEHSPDWEACNKFEKNK